MGAVGSAVVLIVSALALRGAIGLASAMGVVPSVGALMYVAVPLVVVPIVLLACYVPARRAARMDSLAALRES